MELSKNTKIAITGGAGYIGSFTTKFLQSLGFNNLVILDNFSTGYRDTCYAPFHEVDLLDKDKVLDIFEKEKFDAVIHFAALIVVPHSMSNPFWYFHHNFNTSLNVLDAMQKTGVKNIVFSSTCAVYGTPDKMPVSETMPLKPESVYGETKAMMEKVIAWYGKIYGMNYALLRYFNACGAAPDGTRGEKHQPEVHLIPLAINSLLNKQPITIYGNDYPTRDGTCIRDYVHVDDLASAHHLALQHIMGKNTSDIFNLGIGNGLSNLEVVKAVLEEGKKYGLEGSYEFKDRRPGDPPMLYADNSKAKTILGWEPKYTSIQPIVEGAFKWHKNNPVQK